MNINDIAGVAHDVNAAYCRSIGDATQSTWVDAPEWMKQSARNGVIFHQANPDAAPSASHDNWLKEKETEGWVYGPVKDPAKKEHPCMVHFEALPAAQQAKDILFGQVCKSLLPHVSNW